MKKKYKCPCKEGIHTVDIENPIYKELHRLIKLQGEIISVTVLNKGSYLVPRIYIAIHGLKAREIDILGFERIKNESIN